MQYFDIYFLWKGEMLLYYIMLIFSSILLSLDFALNKLYQKTFGTSGKSIFLFNSLLGLASAVLFFLFNGFKSEFTLYSLIMAALMNLFVVFYNIIGFKIMKYGSMATYTLFLMSGGMVIPYICGLLFLNETSDLFNVLGLTVVLFGVIISNISGKKNNIKQPVMCAAVFLLNGCVSVISKVHQSQNVFEAVNSASFIIMGSFFKFIFAGMLYLFYKNKESRCAAKIHSNAICIIFFSALISGISFLLQLSCAKVLPATIQYPFLTGGTVVFSALAGAVFFKEKISPKILFGVIACFSGTVLYALN